MQVRKRGMRPQSAHTGIHFERSIENDDILDNAKEKNPWRLAEGALTWMRKPPPSLCDRKTAARRSIEQPLDLEKRNTKRGDVPALLTPPPPAPPPFPKAPRSIHRTAVPFEQHGQPTAMAKRYFLGWTGARLRTAQMWAVIMPAYLLFGYNQSVAGPLLDLPSWVRTFPQIDTSDASGAQEQRKSTLQGTVVALYTLGCFFGALSCIDLGDRLSRRRLIQLGAVVHIVGAILESSSFSLGQLIAGRFISGFGFGALSATAPNWQSECSPASHRGAVVIMESFFISAGLATAAWINLGMSFTSGSVSWRFPLAFSMFFAIVTIAACGMFPESPRWLLKKGRVDDAKESLSALYGRDQKDPRIQAEVQAISDSLAITGQGRFLDCFKNGELRLLNRACLACAGQMFQQLTGVNALAFYLSTVFETYLGLSSVQARIVSASVFTFQAICSPIGVLTVDRFGRRKLMMVSTIGMGTCMAIIAGTTSQPQNEAAIAVAGAMIFLFSGFFPVGFLGLTYLYASEISPLHVRVPITSMSTASAWIFNFMVTEVTPVGFSSIGYRYFIVYACINLLLIFPAVYLFFPETNGRQLEEVDQIFKDSANPFDPVRAAQRLPPPAAHSSDPEVWREETASDEKGDVLTL